MKRFALALALSACGPHFAFAQEEPSENSDLNSRVQKLEMLMKELKVEKHEPAPSLEILRDTSQLRTQLGPAASKIYFQPRAQWQVGLSSEFFTYQEGDTDRANVLSVAPVLSFRPHSRVIFNAQFLFENGGSERRDTITYQKGQSIVQMAYLDWLSNDNGTAGIRVGHQLIPMGWSNTRNEPVTYLSVLKPDLERTLIPSSWHENGVSLWVDRPRADLQIGVFNSLDARGFRGESFLAGGRSQGQNAKANDLMGVFRVNAKNDWFLLGASIAAGNSAQKDPALRNAGFRLAEVHARARWQNFEVMGIFAQGQLDDAESISIYNGTSMPSTAEGNSVQVSYNILRSERQLWLFARHSNYNLQASMPAGFAADPRLDKRVDVFGASYFPIPNLVIKGDYSLQENAAKEKEGELSLGLGVVF